MHIECEFSREAIVLNTDVDIESSRYQEEKRFSMCSSDALSLVIIPFPHFYGTLLPHS